MILCIKTDSPEAELVLISDSKVVTSNRWTAHRALADTIHINIKRLLDSSKLRLDDIKGIVVYEGPGSYTGLRIGIAVANALANALAVPIAGSSGKNWVKDGVKRFDIDKNSRVVAPMYGSPVQITKPKK